MRVGLSLPRSANIKIMRTKLSFSGYFFPPIGPMSLEIHGGSGGSMSLGPRLSGGSTRVSVTHSFPVAPPPPAVPHGNEANPWSRHPLPPPKGRREGPGESPQGACRAGRPPGVFSLPHYPSPSNVSLVVSIVVESTREIGCVQSNVFFLWAPIIFFKVQHDFQHLFYI